MLLLRAEADEPTTRRLLAKAAKTPLVRRVEPYRFAMTAIPTICLIRPSGRCR